MCSRSCLIHFLYIKTSYLSEKKEIIWMDAAKGFHIKWSKSERERQIPYDITYMWDLKDNTNEPVCETVSRT